MKKIRDCLQQLKKQLIIELENQKIFNQNLPIIIIDDESNEKIREQYLGNINHLKGIYPESRLIFIDGESKKKDIEMISKILFPKLKKENNSILELILNKGNILEYLKKNVFYHISGIRNYTILMLHANNMNKVMNLDDDAPPEVYCLHTKDFKELSRLRKQKKDEVLKNLFVEVSNTLNKEINNEK